MTAALLPFVGVAFLGLPGLALAGPQEDPVAAARAALAGALERAGRDARAPAPVLLVSGHGGPEAYQTTVRHGEILVDGGDATGVLYGALELCEALDAGRQGALLRSGPANETLDGAGTLAKFDAQGVPWLRDRGLNLFLTLPWDDERNGPDRDAAALGDPARWWFHDEDYWETLFDAMARARLNWLDLHGAYDLETTRFPNLYAYFVDSATFPEVGIASALKAKNLERLRRVIARAHARGVRVSLMSYEAVFWTPHRPKVPYPETEANHAAYTREAVERLVRELPGLDAIGFRIGESGHGEGFFRCYLEAVERSGRAIPLLTRSWITRKSQVVPLARASGDFTVEIKFNGEQWGPPYPIAGGRVPGWHSYSFEDYLSDSGLLSPEIPTKRMWQGNPAESGERWPDQPYKIVWQVRANGTHRIFPFTDARWVRRTVRTMKLGTASGFTVEPEHAYYPPSVRAHRADPREPGPRWRHERDAEFLRLWGQLGYDPNKRVGGVSWPGRSATGAETAIAFTARANGPDHRDHAPELEWGGDARALIEGYPFDSHVFQSLQETLAYGATGGRDGRRTLVDAARLLAPDLAPAGDEPPGPLERSERGAASGMQLHRANYDAARFRGAMAAAIAEAAGEDPNDPGPFSAGRVAAAWMRRAERAWAALSISPEAASYRPFTERLRMGTHAFHWREEWPKVRAESARLGAPDFSAARFVADPEPVPRCALRWSESGGEVEARIDVMRALLDGTPVERAWLLEKPLPSSTFFHKSTMAAVAGGFVARFPRKPCGHLLAVEVESRGRVTRLPLWTRETPYLVVPARPEPTPAYYSSQEALRYLRPASLDPNEHGTILVAQRAWDFHRRFDARTQRKLLDPVARGMTLVVLQQDWASGRYPLGWLPRPLLAEARPNAVFDVAGALGMPRIELPGILSQQFRVDEPPPPAGAWEGGASAWQIFGTGGAARLRHGTGEIWLVAARLLQNLHVPSCARALLAILERSGREKPLVLVDAGTEGNAYTNSVIPDFLNAHGIPFLTLGEVVAEKQGAALEPVPGPIAEDDLLGGTGGAAVRADLEARVRAAAARPAPADAAGIAARNAEGRRELLRSLGLDPPPPRTPLGARITGILERPGYRVEKLVFESRPGFPVTAHVYVPAGFPGARLPAIVNAHGHWQHKKAEPVVQARAIAQALRGYLSVVVDSPGHSFEGNAPVERRFAGTHDDPKLALSSSNATAIYVWDLVRLLDYLETRPDVDPARVGITGASGGGLATVYAFGADERFACAVPVCYATSLETNPHNGCLCNHVPATLQIGDRADVLALRAPAPVLVIGATHDAEFPPEGTRRTGEKLSRIWGLLGASDRVEARLFESGHDYNQPMREAAIAFFDRWLSPPGSAAGASPYAEPAIRTEPPLSEELRCLPTVPEGSKTMRRLAEERLRAAAADGSFETLVALNGGRSEAPRAEFREIGSDPNDPRRRYGTIASPGGVLLPGILELPEGDPAGLLVILHDGGKAAAAQELPIGRFLGMGLACLRVDVRGTGELAGLDLRLLAYLGTGAPFRMGEDAARAVRAIRTRAPRVGLVGIGPCAAQAALFGALQERRVGFVGTLGGPERWSDLFADRFPPLALQPRADHAPSLAALRAAAPSGSHFGFGQGSVEGLVDSISAWVAQR